MTAVVHRSLVAHALPYPHGDLLISWYNDFRDETIAIACDASILSKVHDELRINLIHTSGDNGTMSGSAGKLVLLVPVPTVKARWR